MLNVTVASEGARAVSRGSWYFGKRVELTGSGLGAGPGSSGVQGQVPSAVVPRRSAAAGYHSRSMRKEPSSLPLVSSTVVKRTLA